MTIHVIGYTLFLGSTLLLFDTFLLFKRGLKASFLSNFLFTSAAGLLYATYVVYLSDFLRNNFTYHEVYAHSTTTLPTMHKLAASWVGVGGSLFLWLFYQLTIAIIYRCFIADSSHNSSKPLLAYNVLTAALGFLTISTGAFNLLPSRPPAGLGLNPLLVSFWMLVHPPVMFLGYALSLSAAIIASSSGDETVEETLLGLAWIAMTAAIVIGGLWAYEVLGWGGYWNWDSVETASLLPWLSITVYFFSTSKDGRKVAAALAGFFTMFLSFITRSGVLKSLHAYAFSPIGFVFLFIGGLFFLPYLWHKRLIPQGSIPRDLSNFCLTLSRWSLLLIALVCLIGILTRIFAPLIGGLAPSPNYYNSASYPLVMTFLAASIGYSLSRLFDWRRFGGAVLTAMAVGLLLALIKYPTQNPLANFGLPLIITALGAAILGFVIYMRTRNLQALGRMLILIAIPLLLLGVFFSSTAVWRQEATIPLGGSALANGVEIFFTNYTTHPPTGVLYVGEQLVPEYSSVILRLAVRAGRQSTTAVNATMKLHRLYGLVVQPIIVHVGADDVYIAVHLSQELYQLLASLFTNGESPVLSQVAVTVEYKPLVGLVWLGSALLIVGEVAQVLLAFLDHLPKEERLLKFNQDS